VTKFIEEPGQVIEEICIQQFSNDQVGFTEPKDRLLAITMLAHVARILGHQERKAKAEKKVIQPAGLDVRIPLDRLRGNGQ
jgi:hypothetical protein